MSQASKPLAWGAPGVSEDPAETLAREACYQPRCDSEDNSPWRGESRTYGVRYGCCNCHRSFMAKFTFGESAPDKGAECPTCGSYNTVKKWPDC